MLDRPISFPAVLSVVLCVLLGSRVNALPFTPLAGLIGLALLPAFVPHLRFRLVPTLLGTLAVSIAAGLSLTAVNADTHGTSMSVAFSRSLMLLALAGGIGVVLYARDHIGAAPAAIAYGTGMVVAIAFEPISAANAWRFSFSLPLAVLVLAVLSYRARLIPQVGALVALGVIGILNDARSNSAILFLAAVILLWQRLTQAVTRGRRRVGHVVGLVLFAAGFLQLMQFSLLEGYFGEATQAKSEAQLQTSGRLLLGGRPEAAASIALVARYPLGLGSGIQPTGADMYVAKTAMSGIGYDPNNGYVDNFMFGNGIEVHSMLGDFWLWFGWPGLAACLIMVAIVVAGMESRLRTATMSGLLAFLSIRFFWDLMFSPAASAMQLLTLLIPLAALAAGERVQRPPSALVAAGAGSYR